MRSNGYLVAALGRGSCPRVYSMPVSAHISDTTRVVCRDMTHDERLRLVTVLY